MTISDKASHHVIVEYLEQTEIPILSEGGVAKEYSERKQWPTFWFIASLMEPGKMKRLLKRLNNLDDVGSNLQTSILYHFLS